MFYSAEFWKTAAAVDRDMKNLNSKSSKLLYLKENTRMRVIGFSWEDLGTHWSKNGKAFTPEDLALHLKMIISKQWSLSIPTKPPVLLLVKKALPQLGTQAPDVVAVDAACLETSDKFEQQSRRTRLHREAGGSRERYYNMQPTSVPAIYKYMIGKWLEIFLQYFLNGGGTEYFWRQVEVILVSDRINIPKK